MRGKLKGALGRHSGFTSMRMVFQRIHRILEVRSYDDYLPSRQCRNKQWAELMITDLPNIQLVASC